MYNLAVWKLGFFDTIFLRYKSFFQSLIYSGPFEIIELTHLSDGERRNAKRSPGEVPAAPTPNLSCLQIAQSLHHNRWDSCLSFLLHSHTVTHTSSKRRVYTHKWCALIAFIHTCTQRCSQTRHLSQTRLPDSQRHVLYTSADTQIHTFSPILCHWLCCFHLLSVLFLSGSDFHIQGQYQLSTGNITLSYPEHDKSTDAGMKDVRPAVLPFLFIVF